MALSNSNSRGPQGSLAEINITPLVDVMLVLLIIFMVTAPFLQEGIDVDLPQASASASPTQAQDKIITVTQSGEIYLSGEDKVAYRAETLEEKLTAVFSNRSEKVVYLKADKNVPYGSVVQVMSACKKAGIEKIGMVTEPESAGGR